MLGFAISLPWGHPMTTKNSFKGVLAMLLLLGGGLVSAAECKFSTTSPDPATGEPRIATKFVGVATMMADNFGAVQGVSIGGNKFLAMRLRAKNVFPIPPELNIDLEKSSRTYKTGRYDPRLNQVLNRLKQDAAFAAKGSSLRLTLEDRSVIVLRSDADSRARSKGWKPQSDGNDGENFLLLSEVIAQYSLDETTIEALTSRLVTSIRMETADRYYEFASRMNIQYPLTIGEKNGRQLQEALNCALQIKA
jgi:hypothetical protein